MIMTMIMIMIMITPPISPKGDYSPLFHFFVQNRFDRSRFKFYFNPFYHIHLLDYQ